ncbi:MAG: LysM peptidoglycan-binding domain-containing protein [Hymenobacter sp.]
MPAQPTPWRKGETLFGIARRFQLTPEELIKLNKLPAAGTVRRRASSCCSPAAEAGCRRGQRRRAPPAEARRLCPEAKAPAPLPTPAPDKPAQVATVTPRNLLTAKRKRTSAKKRSARPPAPAKLLGRVVEAGLGAPIDKQRDREVPGPAQNGAPWAPLCR